MKAQEIAGASDLLRARDALGQSAWCLVVNGRVCALSIGEVQGDTLFVHVEKARRDLPGAFPAMAQAFVREAASGAKLVNREDDTGDLGLRDSKMRYRPSCLLEKYCVQIF